MKTVQTKPDCTLGFIKMKPAHTGNADLESSVIKDVKIDIGLLTKSNKAPTPIGILSEITEEQAEELVDGVKREDSEEIAYWYCYNPEKANRHSDKKTLIPVYHKAMDSLKSAAESAGIEEKDFDKYLVIKL
jgi:hypothetical protein